MTEVEQRPSKTELQKNDQHEGGGEEATAAQTKEKLFEAKANTDGKLTEGFDDENVMKYKPANGERTDKEFESQLKGNSQLNTLTQM